VGRAAGDRSDGLTGMTTRRSVRRAAAFGAVAAGALAAFVLLWFQPQKLFIDDRVDEAPPGATTAAPPGKGAAAAADAPATLRTLSVAPFRSHEHATEGQARVIRLADGRRYVRFERFRTSNGPLLRVYLSAAPAEAPGDRFDDRFVDLGALKGNIGDQNYALPRAARLTAYRSVVVWCKRFGVPFAAAPVRAR
jgi:hypothetical protein